MDTKKEAKSTTRAKAASHETKGTAKQPSATTKRSSQEKSKSNSGK